MVSTSRCGRDNPGSNPGHGIFCAFREDSDRETNRERQTERGKQRGKTKHEIILTWAKCDPDPFFDEINNLISQLSFVSSLTETPILEHQVHVTIVFFNYRAISLKRISKDFFSGSFLLYVIFQISSVWLHNSLLDT